MEPAEFVCAPLIGFKLEGNCKPISVLMIAAAKSSAKKIMRLAKPSVRPIPTSTAVSYTHLDVYKRQVLLLVAFMASQWPGINCPCAIGFPFSRKRY